MPKAASGSAAAKPNASPPPKASSTPSPANASSAPIPARARCALIGLGTSPHQLPAIVIETAVRDSTEARTLARELRALAVASPATADIQRFFFHPKFPVDVRHNAKIHRLTLASWAATAKGHHSDPEALIPVDSSQTNTPTLVTGGTGFLGRRLVERLLAAGRPVTVLGRTPAPDLEKRGVRFIRASSTTPPPSPAACAGISTIFHTAAKVGVWGRYDDFYRTNVLGTRALLAGARAHGVARFVHTSTPSVVYNGQALANADESLPLTTACPSPYPLTKAIAEREVLAANSATLRTVALRAPPHLGRRRPAPRPPRARPRPRRALAHRR